MSADIDPSKPGKKEGQQIKGQAYNRSSQGRGGYSRYKYHNPVNTGFREDNYQEDLEYNNNSDPSGSTSTNNFRSSNVNRFNNFRGSGKQPGGRFQQKYPDNRNTPKEYNKDNRNFNDSSSRGDQDSSEYSSSSNAPKSPQRGQIVGGRYIRKSNQPRATNSRVFPTFQSENSGTESNSNTFNQPQASNSDTYEDLQSANIETNQSSEHIQAASSRTYHNIQLKNTDTGKKFPKYNQYQTTSCDVRTERNFNKCDKPHENNPIARNYFKSGNERAGKHNQSYINSSKTYRDFRSKNEKTSKNFNQDDEAQVTYSQTSDDSQTENAESEKSFGRHYQSSYKCSSNSSLRDTDSQNPKKTNNSFDRNEVRDSDIHSSYRNGPSYQIKNGDNSSNRYSNSSQSYRYQGQIAEEKNNYKSSFYKQKVSPKKGEDDDKATQRELLISHLTKGECECLVCCELIRTRDQIWHCLSCYHVFHLRCIRKWARSPAAAVQDGSWRCPACQYLNKAIPFNYYCFCGKFKNPEVNYHLTPHSCGEICDRTRVECTHHCKELCHPGPCPPCVVFVQKSCACGKTTQTLPCNQTLEISCQYVCDKLLNCQKHRCKSMCHEGACLPCEETVLQKCHCGKNEQDVACTEDTALCSVYSCGDACDKKLSCGHHTCDEVCHPGDCKSCEMSPEAVKTCCCGKSLIASLIATGNAKQRVSCLDPIPVCGKMCEKKLFCGPAGNHHTCQSLCHEGECPVCPSKTSMKCSCSAFTKEFNCADVQKDFVYKCEKRCNRRKDCGRHKCLNNCCTNFEHRCELVCNKKLKCGLHQCQETCHMGKCPTCWNVSFDELRCHCGTSVLYPPIHCGTSPPECSQPCIRSHPCEHDVKHTCHSDEKCPPCTSLTTKWCYGKHKQCGPVMCFQEGVSCGMPCQKPLPCGNHKCKLTCHPGECLKDSTKCIQPCSVTRPSCGHPCSNPCHEGPCPETPCKAQVTSSCPCGHRSETTTCYDSSKSYRLMSSTILATKMQEIKEGQSVNLSDVLGKKSKNNKLQCNEECAVIERNKRLAVALQIQNPDLSCSPGPPSYSEFVKDEARKNPQLVSDIYEKLSNLVQLAKESKHKCRSHSFPAMNRDQRRIVHELAEFFGCETQSYDEEPKRNVVATAYKNRCWLPFISIMSIVQRDKGIRKGPTPVLAQRDPKSTSGPNASGAPQKKKIDYFDYNE